MSLSPAHCLSVQGRKPHLPHKTAVVKQVQRSRQQGCAVALQLQLAAYKALLRLVGLLSSERGIQLGYVALPYACISISR